MHLQFVFEIAGTIIGPIKHAYHRQTDVCYNYLHYKQDTVRRVSDTVVGYH